MKRKIKKIKRSTSYERQILACLMERLLENCFFLFLSETLIKQEAVQRYLLRCPISCCNELFSLKIKLLISILFSVPLPVTSPVTLPQDVFLLTSPPSPLSFKITSLTYQPEFSRAKKEAMRTLSLILPPSKLNVAAHTLFQRLAIILKH